MRDAYTGYNLGSAHAIAEVWAVEYHLYSFHWQSRANQEIGSIMLTLSLFGQCDTLVQIQSFLQLLPAE